MSIITSYLRADEEDKKRYREDFMSILKNTYTAGMLSGGGDILSSGWDKAKEIGGEWWQNISRDPTVNMDAYTTHWLERLGHEGPPLKEDSIYRGDIAAWETDYREYWDTKPLY